MSVPTWKQEVADAITPIDGVNGATCVLSWNINIGYDPDSDLPMPDDGIFHIVRKAMVKSPVSINTRLIDGKNYIAGDMQTEIAWLKYLALREPAKTDPAIVQNNVPFTLEDVRPLNQDYGFDLGIDSVLFGSDEWYIVKIDPVGIMDNNQGSPSPAKLILTLRKG
jgi:hypothetical protein